MALLESSFARLDVGASHESPRRSRRPSLTAAIALILALGAPSLASAQQPLVDDNQPLPAGHPPTGAMPEDALPQDAEGLPPGHPPTEGRPSPGPLGSLKQSSSEVDASLPAGTIVVELLDGAGKPMPHAEFTLGILQQSVSKGESRKRVAAKTDEKGEARFDGLETGSGVAYRASVVSEVKGAESARLATHDAPPFQLNLEAGERVRLYVFPTSTRIEDSLVGLRAMLYVEVKDDALQIEQAFTVFNLGKTTWVPDDVIVDLPAGFRAFVAPKGMTDVAFEQVAGRGARLQGTFSPGQHEVGMRYQIPWDGEESMALALGLPPHVAQMTVVSEATKGMSLTVSDFPPAEPNLARTGQRILITERQLQPGDAQLTQLRISLDNLPGHGPGRWIALGLAGLALAGGVWTALQQSKKGSETHRELERDAVRARERLVEELSALEKAKESGEVGPQTYERVRKMLVDALARLLPAS